MAVWVRVLGLPVEYFKDSTLTTIGKLLGSVVKVDKLTLAQSRGKFGRLCVEIDLLKPLVPYMEVEDTAYSIIYEGISMICFNCGCYGHTKANCTIPITSSSASTNSMNEKDSTGPDNDNTNMIITNDSVMETPAPDTSNKSNDTHMQSLEAGHGPWMLMSYKNKKPSSSKSPNNAAPSTSGSRFALLQTFSEGDDALHEEAPTAIESLSLKPASSEPKIVTMWKKVQDKAKWKPIASNPHNPSDNFVPSIAKSQQPLVDITNGKSVMSFSSNVAKNTNRTLPSSQNRRKNLSINKSNHKVHFSSLNSLISGEQPQPTQSGAPILFGHCPPEILDCCNEDSIPMDALQQDPPHND
ncbi:hypothetical protein M0R45_016580 [Rubus argutus]|uniref:CCHC-type domain-containing protein n=1 Tax=Rubus argutus TaxID=59490 RepID=A0AAW1XVF8_RUBAR